MRGLLFYFQYIATVGALAEHCAERLLYTGQRIKPVLGTFRVKYLTAFRVQTRYAMVLINCRVSLARDRRILCCDTHLSFPCVKRRLLMSKANCTLYFVSATRFIVFVICACFYGSHSCEVHTKHGFYVVAHT